MMELMVGYGLACAFGGYCLCLARHRIANVFRVLVLGYEAQAIAAEKKVVAQASGFVDKQKLVI